MKNKTLVECRQEWSPIGGVVARLACSCSAPRSWPSTAGGRLVPAVQAQALSNPVAAQAPRTMPFNIAAGPLGEVLTRLRAGRRRQGRACRSTRSPTSSRPGVSGTFTRGAGAAAVADGHGGGGPFHRPVEAVLELRTRSESVEVTAGAPTVQSPKYSVPLRDIPQTIEVIPRAAMEEQGATTLSDALRNVPGITLQAGEGGGASSTAGDMFNMRGFNASNSLFVDNVRDDGLVAARRLQPGAGRGVHGADRLRRRPRHRRRLREHADEDAASAARRARRTLSFGTADQRRAHGRLQPAARRRRKPDSWMGKSRRSPERAVAGQRRRRPGRGGERDARRSRRRSASGLGTPTRVTSRPRRSLRQDNLPDYGIPGAAWQDAPLAPTTVPAPARRSIRATTTAARRTTTTTPIQDTRHGARRARPDPRAGRCAIRPATTRPSAKRSSARCRTSPRSTPATEPGDDRPSGQRAREHDHVEPDER